MKLKIRSFREWWVEEDNDIEIWDILGFAIVALTFFIAGAIVF